MPDKPRRILLVKQSERMGNIILLNVAVDALNRQFGETAIELLLPAAYADLMADDPRIARVIPVYKREYIIRPWRLLSLISELRRQKYDLAVDCSDVNSHSLTGVIYTLVCGAKLTAGWKISDSPVFDIEIPRYEGTAHATEMYLRLIGGVFGEPMTGDPYFVDSVETVASADSVIGINCGGRGSKRWSLENFIELGERLSASGLAIEYILGPEEEDSRAVLRDRLPKMAKLLPLMTLPELKKRIRGHSAFVSSDTGPMHLAWCLGIPTLALFLDSEPDKFKPLSPGSVALDGSVGITPKVVFDTVVKMIESGRIPA